MQVLWIRDRAVLLLAGFTGAQSATQFSDEEKDKDDDGKNTERH